MSVLTVFVAVALVFPTFDAFPDDERKMLFKTVDTAKLDLSAKQKRLLEKVQSSADTVGSPRLAKLGLKLSVQLKDPLHIQLPGIEKELAIENYSVSMDEATSALLLTWRSNGKKNLLTWTNGDCTGVIYANKKVFHVQPLGEGIHVIVEIDQSKLIDEPKAPRP